MGQRLPINAEAVITNGLEEAIAVGVIKYEHEVLTERERNANLEWVACHLLACLRSHGYQIRYRTHPAGVPI
jgi:hypothetical protein